MSWDGIKRRKEDNGEEPPETKIARIDENVKFLKSGAEFVRIQLDNHEKKDDIRFKEMNDRQEKTNSIILLASGAVAVIVFILNWIKH